VCFDAQCVGVSAISRSKRAAAGRPTAAECNGAKSNRLVVPARQATPKPPAPGTASETPIGVSLWHIGWRRSTDLLTVLRFGAAIGATQQTIARL
jgi:Tfp pilus assembly protein FimV